MKVGDYVEIEFGVDNKQMPIRRRDGLVVELKRNDHILVMLSNGAFLKFPKSKVKLIKGDKNERAD